MKTKISIITPVYNEEENIRAYYARMNHAINSLVDIDFEIIFTDNCSTDKSFQILAEISQQDPRVRVLSFSKNFGYQKSILTGYQHATGNAAIEFDCDLQDPPELMSDFIHKWLDGYDIVYGIRTQRKENFLINISRAIFYRLIRSISEDDLPNDAGDFMLIDQKILSQLKLVEDQNLYLRGLVFSFGFKKIGIPYSRDKRQRGSSKFPIRRMIALAIDGIVSQSVVPLRISSYLGFCVALFTLFLSSYYLFLKLFMKTAIPAGFTTTIILILFSISLNALFLGIIGEYLSRIYIQTKKRPLTIISKRIN